jgi:Ohr subfamily peroxiredoxin
LRNVTLLSLIRRLVEKHRCDLRGSRGRPAGARLAAANKYRCCVLNFLDPTGALMAKTVYTAEATVTGGRAEGHGASSDRALDVQLRTPTEMGGDGGGTNPEQLFAVGYAACFEGALGVVGRREHAEVGDVSIDSHVSLITTEDRGFNVAVELNVTLPQVTDAEEAARIVAAAHEVCPYSNATRGNIEVKLTANGQDVAAASAR